MLSSLLGSSAPTNEENIEYKAAYVRIKYFVESSQNYLLRNNEVEEMNVFFQTYSKRSHYIIYNDKIKFQKRSVNILKNIYDQEDYDKLPNNKKLIFEDIGKRQINFQLFYTNPVNIRIHTPTTFAISFCIEKSNNLKVATIEQITFVDKLAKQGLFLNTALVKPEEIKHVELEEDTDPRNKVIKKPTKVVKSRNRSSKISKAPDRKPLLEESRPLYPQLSSMDSGQKNMEMYQFVEHSPPPYNGNHNITK